MTDTAAPAPADIPVFTAARHYGVIRRIQRLRATLATLLLSTAKAIVDAIDAAPAGADLGVVVARVLDPLYDTRGGMTRHIAASAARALLAEADTVPPTPRQRDDLAAEIARDAFAIARGTVGNYDLAVEELLANAQRLADWARNTR